MSEFTLNKDDGSLGLGASHSRGGNAILRCKTLVDDYDYGLVHGLQKDSIQNALDARESKKKPAIVEFEIIENKIGRFLTITDKNTKGLRGAARNDPNANVEDEDADWLRFEGSNDTKIGPDSIGARGQGKFVMLYASNEYKMFYDTLRADGIYRLGATQALKDDFPIWPKDTAWENEIAEDKLLKYCGLQPLQENGTRLIIFNPKEEVLEAIKNDDLKKAIQETWFRAIEKKQLEVYIIRNGNYEYVEDPDIATDTNTPSAKSWVSDIDFDDKTIIASVKNKDRAGYSQIKYKIKRFEAYYDPDQELDEAWQGIAIIHNGMKICVPGGNRLPTEIKEKVTGFIEFEKDLDQELRKGHNQRPNHYDLKWARAVPQAIKSYINQRLDDFGNQKLGLSQDPKEKKKRVQIDAENWAMDMLKKLAPDLNLFGAPGRGNSKPIPESDTPPPPDRDIGITFKGFTFPDDSRKPRVNWGEKIFFNLSAFNKTNDVIKGEVSLRVLKDDMEIDNLIDDDIEGDIEIAPNNLDHRIKSDPFTLDINESEFSETGKYRILAKLFDESGNELHKTSKPFWVEEDPPRNNAPFEQRHSPLQKPFLAWETRGSIGNSPILYFNTIHPEYERASNNDDDFREYIFKLCLEGAIHFTLSLPTDSDADDLYAPLDTEIIKSGDPARIHEEAMKYIAQIRWKKVQAEGG